MLLLYSCVSYSQSIKSSKTIEDRIIDTIMKIPEVKEKAKYVEKQSHRERHLSCFIYKKPSKELNYYWIKVAEDNGVNYDAHFNFYVDPKNLAIKYLDIVKDTAIDLKIWQKSRNSKSK